MLRALALIICIALTNASKLKVHTDVTDEQYVNTPTIFRLDDFDSCLALRDPTLYCFVSLELSPTNQENPSPTWEIIKELNSAPRNYRHDLLRHGICLPRTCSKVPTEYYSLGNGTQQLWDGISQCYTDRYKYFGIRATVNKLHCENKTNFYEINHLDLSYLICIGLFSVLIVIGTLHELFSKPGVQTKSMENKKCNCTAKFLHSFSLRKNMEYLLSTSKGGQDLIIFRGVRFIYICFFIVLHSMMVSMSVPVYNTKFAEDITTKPYNMMFVNGGLMYQTFFLISGWMMSYKIFTKFQGNRICVKDIIKMFILRIIKVVSMLSLVIGFSLTWFRHVNNGPIWEHLVGLDYKRCKHNSIWAFLFLSNYYKSGEMCLQQSWFTSAEMQMFIVGLLITKLLSGHQRHAMKIFIFFILSGICISFMDAYYNQLEITSRMYPETIYNAFDDSKSWLHINIQGHSQLPSFVQGLLCGYYYYKFKMENTKFNIRMVFQVIVQIVFWVNAMGLMFCGYMFYQEGSEFTRLQSGLYHGFVKYLFTLPISAGMFGAVFGVGGFIKDLFSSVPFQILGKPTFSIFLTHMFIIKMRLGVIRSPLYLSNYTLIVDAIGDVAVSFVVGTLIYLVFELPLSAVLKSLSEREIVMKSEEKKKK